MNRRNFLNRSAALLFCAPAIVKAENLMNIWVPPEKKIVTLDFGDATVSFSEDLIVCDGEVLDLRGYNMAVGHRMPKIHSITVKAGGTLEVDNDTVLILNGSKIDFGDPSSYITRNGTGE